MNFVYIYYYKNSKFTALILLKFSTIMYLRVCSSQRKEARISTHIANAFKIFTEGSKIIQISRHVKISLTISREKSVYQLFESRTKHIRKLFLSPSVSRILIFTFLRTIGERFFAKRVQNSDTEKIEEKKKSREKFSRRNASCVRESILLLSSNTSCLPRCRTGRGVLVSQRFPPRIRGW